VWDAYHNDPNMQRRLVRATIERGEGFTPHSMREAVYKVAKECTQFKASLTVCIFRRFGAQRVLDISAGWGDRLLGSCSHCVRALRMYLVLILWRCMQVHWHVVSTATWQRTQIST